MSMMTDVAVRSQIRNRATQEFLTSYEWDFEFVNPPSILGSDFQKNLRLRCTEVATPEEPQSPNMSVNIRGHIFSQVGMIMHNGAFVLTVQDFSDMALQKPIMEMLYAICDPITKAVNGSVNDYRFNFKLYQMNAEREIVKVWKCKDCLLQAINVNDSMTSDKSIIGQMTLNISTDCFTVEYPTAATSLTTDPTYYDGKSAKLF